MLCRFIVNDPVCVNADDGVNAEVSPMADGVTFDRLVCVDPVLHTAYQKISNSMN